MVREQGDKGQFQARQMVSQGNLSGHLTKLEEAGYVEIEKKFKGKVPLTVCRLTSDGKTAYTR
jgi:DNA-binding transcriptional ArsR family regulator